MVSAGSAGARLRRWSGELHDHHGQHQSLWRQRLSHSSDERITESARQSPGQTGLLHRCVIQLASIPSIVRREALKRDAFWEAIAM